MYFNAMYLQWLLVVLACLTAPAFADFKDHGPYRVHYTTFASTLIPADVAKQHQITRAENRIVLNVSVIRGSDPAAAKVSGTVINLLNQQYDLEFDEVNEAEAIYYLANHLAIEQDILRFSLTIDLPEVDPLDIQFLRRYD